MRCFDLSTDGALLLSGDARGCLTLWRASSGAMLHCWPGAHAGGITALCAMGASMVCWLCCSISFLHEQRGCSCCTCLHAWRHHAILCCAGSHCRRGWHAAHVGGGWKHPAPVPCPQGRRECHWYGMSILRKCI